MGIFPPTEVEYLYSLTPESCDSYGIFYKILLGSYCSINRFYES